MVDTPVNGREPTPASPDIAAVLDAFSTVANSVAHGVLAHEGFPSSTDDERMIALLHALAASVQAIGNEYQRIITSQTLAAGQRHVVGVGH